MVVGVGGEIVGEKYLIDFNRLQGCRLLGANGTSSDTGGGEAGSDLPRTGHAVAATESGGSERR